MTAAEHIEDVVPSVRKRQIDVVIAKRHPATIGREAEVAAGWARNAIFSELVLAGSLSPGQVIQISARMQTDRREGMESLDADRRS